MMRRCRRSSRRCRVLSTLLGSTLLAGASSARGECFGPHAIVAPDGAANDHAGTAVALSGAFAIVGAPMDDGVRNEEGSASIYRFESGQWLREARLTAPTPTRNQLFGATVDISGDTAVVGYGAFGGLFPAYVFVRDSASGAWSHQQQVFAEPSVALEQFASAVAIDGDTLVVGAPLHTSTAGTSQGAVYVFTRSGTTWTQQAKLIPNDAAAFAEFGTSVDIDGDTVIAGAPGDVRRAAYIFVRSGSTWTQQGKLIAGKGAPAMGFGRRVAVSGDAAVVGAPLHDGPAGADQGAAYVYHRSGSAWIAQGALRPSDAQAGAQFGASVAIDGDTMLVGRFTGAEAQTGGTRGAAWIFERDGGAWMEIARLEDLASVKWDRFGFAVDLDGNTAIVGAPWALNGPPKKPIRTGDATSFHRVNGQWMRRTPGDADLDGEVTFVDVTVVIACFGANYRPGTGPGDSNGDGVVNNLDLGTVTGNWRLQCP